MGAPLWNGSGCATKDSTRYEVMVYRNTPIKYWIHWQRSYHPFLSCLGGIPFAWVAVVTRFPVVLFPAEGLYERVDTKNVFFDDGWLWHERAPG